MPDLGAWHSLPGHIGEVLIKEVREVPSRKRDRFFGNVSAERRLTQYVGILSLVSINNLEDHIVGRLRVRHIFGNALFQCGGANRIFYAFLTGLHRDPDCSLNLVRLPVHFFRQVSRHPLHEIVFCAATNRVIKKTKSPRHPQILSRPLQTAGVNLHHKIVIEVVDLAPFKRDVLIHYKVSF